MKIIKLRFIILFVVLLLVSCTTKQEQYIDDTFKAGQVWSYHTRPGEEESNVTILKIEEDDKLGVIVHIAINGLNMKSPEGTKDNIGHLPYGKIALKESLIAILSQDKQVPDFSEGYSTWKTEFDNNRAGIWSIPLSEAIGAMEEALNQ